MQSSDLKPGDIMACHGTDIISQVIRYGTASMFGPSRLRFGPSHVAMIVPWVEGKVWFESTSLTKEHCIYRGRSVRGVQVHSPFARIDEYVGAGGFVDVYRLSDIDQLTKEECDLLQKIVFKHFLPNEVDYDTIGAIISGTRVLKMTRLLPSDALRSVFCSEVLAAILQRLHRMNRANPTKFNPACLLRRLITEGTYTFVNRIK